jgi:hypothetical protein
MIDRAVDVRRRRAWCPDETNEEGANEGAPSLLPGKDRRDPNAPAAWRGVEWDEV